jgi:hypothetical protein
MFHLLHIILYSAVRYYIKTLGKLYCSATKQAHAQCGPYSKDRKPVISDVLITVKMSMLFF